MDVGDCSENGAYVSACSLPPCKLSAEVLDLYLPLLRSPTRLTLPSAFLLHLDFVFSLSAELDGSLKLGMVTRSLQ